MGYECLYTKQCGDHVFLEKSYLITKSSSLLNFVNMESINWCENPWIFNLVSDWGWLRCLVLCSMLWILTVFQSFSFHQSWLSSWQVKIDKIDLFLQCKYIIPSDKYVESWIGIKIDLLLYASISFRMMHTLWETCPETFYG